MNRGIRFGIIMSFSFLMIGLVGSCNSSNPEATNAVNIVVSTSTSTPTSTISTPPTPTDTPRPTNTLTPTYTTSPTPILTASPKPTLSTPTNSVSIGEQVCAQFPDRTCITFGESNPKFLNHVSIGDDQTWPQNTSDSISFFCDCSNEKQNCTQYIKLDTQEESDNFFIPHPYEERISGIEIFARVESWLSTPTPGAPGETQTSINTCQNAKECPSGYFEISCGKNPITKNEFFINPLFPYYVSSSTQNISTYLVNESPTKVLTESPWLEKDFYFFRFSIKKRTKEIHLWISNDFGCLLETNPDSRVEACKNVIHYYWDGDSSCQNYKGPCTSFDCWINNDGFSFGIFTPTDRRITMKLYAITLEIEESNK